ncbi:MASE3 domain-containing protein [Anaerobacillus sp. MEB173]|uniref:MASE3 domain-containing protein n=1 Tax=Anaerobacillus sp. MEB173 TaxID=3383345 RepID=UPI003F8E67CF
MRKLNKAEKKTLLIAVIAILVLLSIRLLSNPLHEMYDPINHLAVHLILEFFSITISFAIFLYGWLTYRHYQSQQLLMIGAIFLAVGVLDLFHTLTFKGMPYFITESSIQKATLFWLAARFTEAIFMLAAILLPRKNNNEKDYRYVFLAIAMSYVSFFAFVIYMFEHSFPVLVIEGMGTTPLKNGIEYVISLIHIIAILIIFTYYRKNQNPAELSIALAFFFLLVSELIFTMYKSVYDFDNFLGHLYKVIGYYYLLKGFFFPAIDEPFTQNKLIKDQLSTTQQQFKAMFDFSADAIVIIDLQRIVLHVNPAFQKIFGYHPAEVIGKPLPIIPSEKEDEAKRLFTKIKAGESVIDFETERQRKDGMLIHVSYTVSPIRNDEGNVIFFSIIVRDISHRKETEELLIKSEKLSVVGQLSAGFAHEIRNPLTTIKGFIQLIERNSNDEHNQYFSLIKSELNRIEFITNEFMSVAKPQALQYKKENISNLIFEVTRFMDPQALMYNVQIFTSVEEGLPPITCEANQLKQVLINLLKNAIESMPKGGNVFIKLSRIDEQSVSISITDQGCGIPAELLPRLGEPFYTLKEKGTGLGLMVTYKIIEEHNGTIEVDTELNKGTTFTVTLPIDS